MARNWDEIYKSTTTQQNMPAIQTSRQKLLGNDNEIKQQQGSTRNWDAIYQSISPAPSVPISQQPTQTRTPSMSPTTPNMLQNIPKQTTPHPQQGPSGIEGILGALQKLVEPKIDTRNLPSISPEIIQNATTPELTGQIREPMSRLDVSQIPKLTQAQQSQLQSMATPEISKVMPVQPKLVSQIKHPSELVKGMDLQDDMLSPKKPEEPKPEVEGPTISAYKPTTLDRIKDFENKTKETIEYLATGIAKGIKLPEILKGLNIADIELKASEDAKHISPITAEISETVGGIVPYIAGGPIATGVKGTATAGLTRVAPKLATGAAGRILPTAAGTAALGGGVTAIQEGIGAIMDPKNFEPVESTKKIIETAAHFGVFGVASSTAGHATRTAMNRLLPKALESGGVTPALQRLLISASGGAATGTTIGAVDTTIRFIKNPAEFDSAEAAGDILGQAAFFAGLDTMFALLHAPRGTVGRRATKPQDHLHDYEFMAGTRNPAKEGFKEWKPGSGVWLDPKTNLPVLREVVKVTPDGAKAYRLDMWKVERAAGRQGASKEPPARKAPKTATHTTRQDGLGGLIEGQVTPQAQAQQPAVARTRQQPQAEVKPVETKPPTQKAPSDVVQGGMVESKPVSGGIVPKKTEGEIKASVGKQEVELAEPTETKPTTIQEGQTVYNNKGDKLTVVDTSDKSMLTVKNEKGTEFKIGRKVVNIEEPKTIPTTPKTTTDKFITQETIKETSEEIRKAIVGDKLKEGEVVLTATDRKTTPFPKSARKVDSWLIDNAIEEAKARNDEFNLLQFENINRKNISKSDKDSAELYLFSEEVIKPLEPSLKVEQLKPEETKAEEKEETREEIIGKAKEPAKEVAQADLPIKVSPNDIDFDLVRRAYSGISFDPDKRAEQVQKDYVNSINDVYSEMNKYAQTNEQKELLRSEIERYKKGYLKHMNTILAATSRTISPMITGSANFPVARNEKANKVEQKRIEEFLAWDKKARASIKKRLEGAKSKEQVTNEEFTRLMEKANATIESISQIKSGALKVYNASLFRNSIKGMLERSFNNGNVEQVQEVLRHIQKQQDEKGITVFANNNAIWKLLKKPPAKTEVKTGETPIAEYDGARIVNNHDAERIQIFLDVKPADSVIADIKKRGWHWSPTNGAWQRKNTLAAEHSAKRILDEHYQKVDKLSEQASSGFKEARPFDFLYKPRVKKEETPKVVSTQETTKETTEGKTETQKQGFEKQETKAHAPKIQGKKLSATLYRGEVKPSEVAGKDINIMQPAQLPDVLPHLQPENVLKRETERLNRLNEQLKKSSNDFEREQIENNIDNSNKLITRARKEISDKKDLEKIIADNDLLYLTSQKETAESYAKQLEGKPSEVFTKPQDYRPTIREFEANFDSLIDLTTYGEKGLLKSESDWEKLLTDLGFSKPEATKFIEYNLNNEPLAVDGIENMPVFKMFRGRNLPVAIEKLQAGNYDAIRFTEGNQDNIIALDRSKIKENIIKEPKLNEQEKTGEARPFEFLYKPRVKKEESKPPAEVKQEVKQETKKPTETNPFKRAAQFKNNFHDGEPMTVAEVKDHADWVMNNETQIKEALSSLKNDQLNRMLSPMQHGRYTKKADLVDALYSDDLSWLYYNIGDTTSLMYQLGTQRHEDYVKEQIKGILDNLTQEKLDNILAKEKKAKADYLAKKEKQLEGLKEPKNIEDFERKKRIKGLTPAEQDKYEDLLALQKKEREQSAKEREKERAAETVAKAGDYTIEKTKHTKTGEDLWVVKLAERLPKEEYRRLRAEMSKLKGSWSNFTKGFNFKYDPTEALGGQSVEAIPVAEPKGPDKLRQVADNMQSTIDDKRGDRLTNTARRASMAAGAEAEANRLERIQTTMRNLADGIEKGEVVLLDKVSARTEIEALEGVLGQAKRTLATNASDESRKKSPNDHVAHSQAYKEAMERPFDNEIIRLAKFPGDSVWKSNLQSLVNEAKKTPGLKMIANRLQKLIDRSKEDKVELSTKKAVEDFKKLVKGVKDSWRYAEEVSERNRLERLGIETEGDLRAHLREYINYRPGKKEKTAEELVKDKQRELIGRKIEGYFPTPKETVSKMLEYAEIKKGDKVLEPSAGQGHIADLIGTGKVDVVEWNTSNREILEMKGHSVIGNDALEVKGKYDKIVMNPPFEKGQDIDHVRYAFDNNLKDGGRLVAIMSEGPFFRGDKKATEFREWLESVGGTSEKLPEGAFKSSDRPTGVNTRMVVIDKEAEVKVAAESKTNLTKEERIYLDYLKAQGTTLSESIKALQQKHDLALKDHINYLKSSGGKGVEPGGLGRDREGEVVVAFGRISNNPKWYRDFYAENKRKPNQKEYEQLALKHLREGYMDDYGEIPPHKEFVELEGALNGVKKLSEKVAANMEKTSPDQKGKRDGEVSTKGKAKQTLEQVQEKMAKKLEEDASRKDTSKHIGIVPPGMRGKQTVKYKYEDAEIEQRHQEAHGMPTPNKWEEFKGFLDGLVRKMSRDFEHLPYTGYYMPLRNEIHNLTKYKGVAGMRSVRAMQGILVDLKDNAEMFNVFERKVILDDLLEGYKMYEQNKADLIKEGKATEKDFEPYKFPFGFNLDKLNKEIKRIEAEVQRNPDIKKALESRREFWDALVPEYVKAQEAIGNKVEDKFKRKNYYRHIVMEYAADKDAKSIVGTGKRLKSPKYRGFLKRRIESGHEKDFNTNYLESEFEVMSQMLYDIRLAEAIKVVNDKYNIVPMLKAEAIQVNDERIMPFFEQMAEMMKDQDGKQPTAKDLYKKILNTKQAIGFDKLGQLASVGVLPDNNGMYENLISELASSYEINKIMRKNKDFKTSDLTGLSDSGTKDLFKYMSWILNAHKNSEAARAATTVFKGIREKKDTIKKMLGKEYVTWEDLIPEGYSSYQPTKGHVFYFSDTIPATMATQLYANALEEIGVKKEDLQRVMAKGQKFPEMVVKEEIAETLENLVDETYGPTATAFRAMLTGWKVYQLISPLRIVKYNLRNYSSDVEMPVIANADSFKYHQRSMKELYNFFRNGNLTKELSEWLERGGIQGTLQAQEMGEVGQLKVFRNLINKDGSWKELPAKAWDKYWRSARMATDFRESILRYATFLSYIEQMKSNPQGSPKNFGGSIPEEIMALDNHYDRAYWLSNELIGAYDRVSQGGRWIRANLIPFWSWQEVNFRRFTRFIKNVSNDQALSETVGKALMNRLGLKEQQSAGGSRFKSKVLRSPLLASKLGILFLRMMAVWVAVEVWNRTMFPEAIEELSEETKRRFYIIYGRDSKGRILYFDRLGFMESLTDWMGGAPWNHYNDFVKNRKNIKEIASEMVTAPVNVVATGLRPEFMFIELASRKKLFFPDIRRPATIQDPYYHLFQGLGLESVYTRMVGKPGRSLKDEAIRSLMYIQDPGQGSYYNIRSEKERFMKEVGKRPWVSGSVMDAKGQSLFNLKLAIRYEDFNAMKKFIVEYYNAGGDPDGIMTSLENMNPLHGLNQNEKVYFVNEWLDDAGRNQLSLANKFYHETLLGETPEKTLEMLGKFTNEYIQTKK